MFIIIWISTKSTSAVTDYGPYCFATDDGKWDGKFATRSGDNVTAFFKDGGSPDWLKVRLCSVGGDCTIYKLVTNVNY